MCKRWFIKRKQKFLNYKKKKKIDKDSLFCYKRKHKKFIENKKIISKNTAKI